MGSERSACGESDTLTPFSLLSGCGWDTLDTLIRHIVVVAVVVDINTSLINVFWLSLRAKEDQNRFIFL